MNFNIDNNTYLEDDIKNDPNGIILNPDTNDNNNDTSNLPYVPDILDNITEILTYMMDEQLLQMKKNDRQQFDLHMEDKFKSFADRYYGIFIKLLNGDDITPLMSMLKSIEDIQAGNITMEQAERKLGDELADRFIYPNLRPDQVNQIKTTLKDKNFQKNIK
jgi:hypothetical protein